ASPSYFPIPTYSGMGKGVGLTPAGRIGFSGVPFAHEATTRSTTNQGTIRITFLRLLPLGADHPIGRRRGAPGIPSEILDDTAVVGQDCRCRGERTNRRRTEHRGFDLPRVHEGAAARLTHAHLVAPEPTRRRRRAARSIRVVVRAEDPARQRECLHGEPRRAIYGDPTVPGRALDIVLGERVRGRSGERDPDVVMLCSLVEV